MIQNLKGPQKSQF